MRRRKKVKKNILVLARAAALALLPALLLSCQRLEVDRLYAVHVGPDTKSGHLETAVPLTLKAGGGNVSGRDERMAELERDTDPVHVGSASCHHGPPVTDPVFLEARATYTDDTIRLEVLWDDSTPDTSARAWTRTPEGWILDEGDEDGIALLWSRVAGPFGCQEACHMSDFALRKGELIDLRSMRMAAEGEWEEAWVWKSSQGAQALILGQEGFATAEDEKVYRTLNSVVAADDSLRPEARRAGTFGGEDRPLMNGDGKPLPDSAIEAPAYLYGGRDGGGGLTARAERRRTGWKVIFSRALVAGEGRQVFRAGERYRFGVAVFDGTSTNHHLVRDTQTLELLDLTEPSASPLDGKSPGESDGIL